MMQADKLSPDGSPFFRGTGEMSELMRRMDWAHHPLGEPAGWPPALRHVVALMLENPFGMYIAWGPDYIQLYNDGFRPILGSQKHPAALGSSSRATFGEIWYGVGPMFERVMAGDAIRVTDQFYRLNRNGFEEDCWFDFAYSPVRVEDGSVGGVLVTVIETTSQQTAKASLKEQAQELQFAIEAAELATWDYNPVTGKFTSNARLKEWFVLPAAADSDLSQAMEAIAAQDRDRVAQAIETSLQPASGGKYDIEYSLIHPLTGHKRIVRTKGRAWFDENGNGYRLNGTVQDITEQANARLALEKSEEQLRIALDGGELGTFDYFPAEGKLLWSAKTKELFGLPPDAQVNFDVYLQALHPEDKNNSQALTQQQARLSKGGLYELEYRTIGITDGKLRWVRSKGKITYDAGNSPVRYTGIVQDITPQKQAEATLKAKRAETEQLQRLYEAVTGNTPDLVYIFGLDYRFTYANPALLSMWGKTYEDAVGKSLLENGYEPWHAEMHQREIDQVIATKKPIRGTVSFPHAELGKRVYDYIFAPVLDENGHVEAIAGTTRDITDITLAEEELKDSEGRFRTLAETLPQLVWVTDASGEQEYVSRRWKEYSGIEPTGEETWKQIVHPGDWERMVATWTGCLITGGKYREELRLRNTDGQYLWHFVQAEAIRDEQGQILKWIGAFTNIHEQKMKEQQKDDFNSIASHEMKTPLTTAKGYIELLQQVLANGDEQPALFAGKAGQAINRLQNLVTTLLDASKIQNGRLDYHITVFDFNALTDETIAQLQHLAGRHLIQKKGTITRPVAGDKDRLQQVLINLISNAIKYSPDADTVIVELKEAENQLHVMIEDFGVGMSPQHLDKVFDRYYRVHEHSGRFQGLGIGLYISHQIINGHGGTIWVESEPGKGSRFHFTLPLQ